MEYAKLTDSRQRFEHDRRSHERIDDDRAVRISSLEIVRILERLNLRGGSREGPI